MDLEHLKMKRVRKTKEEGRRRDEEGQREGWRYTKLWVHIKCTCLGECDNGPLTLFFYVILVGSFDFISKPNQ